MEELITLFVNNGTAIAVIIFFMYRELKFSTQLQTTLQTLVTLVENMSKEKEM